MRAFLTSLCSLAWAGRPRVPCGHTTLLHFWEQVNIAISFLIKLIYRAKKICKNIRRHASRDALKPQPPDQWFVHPWGREATYCSSAEAHAVLLRGPRAAIRAPACHAAAGLSGLGASLATHRDSGRRLAAGHAFSRCFGSASRKLRPWCRFTDVQSAVAHVSCPSVLEVQ